MVKSFATTVVNKVVSAVTTKPKTTVATLPVVTTPTHVPQVVAPAPPVAGPAQNVQMVQPLCRIPRLKRFGRGFCNDVVQEAASNFLGKAIKAFVFATTNIPIRVAQTVMRPQVEGMDVGFVLDYTLKMGKVASIGIGEALNFGNQILEGETPKDAFAKTVSHIAGGMGITAVVGILGLVSWQAVAAIVLGSFI